MKLNNLLLIWDRDQDEVKRHSLKGRSGLPPIKYQSIEAVQAIKEHNLRGNGRTLRYLQVYIPPDLQKRVVNKPVQEQRSLREFVSVNEIAAVADINDN